MNFQNYISNVNSIIPQFSNISILFYKYYNTFLKKQISAKFALNLTEIYILNIKFYFCEFRHISITLFTYAPSANDGDGETPI